MEDIFEESLSIFNEQEHIWYTLKNYENYEITKTGFIRNKKTKKILSRRKNSNEYIEISLCINKKSIKQLVHRLLAIQFIPNENNYKSVDHINRIKYDNSLENLRWASQEIQHNNRTKRKNISGTHLYQYDLDMNFIKKYNSMTEAAESINLSSKYFRTKLLKK